ncbi:MAG TPA: hypothetical protein VFR24_16495 [Candidatus Angelobacter sp.]|nr:hypothetical protein [Candidatus Angelobacter sp.]
MTEDADNSWRASGRSLLTRIGYYTSPWRPWTPAAAIVLAYLARQTGSVILRGISAVAALILFLMVSVDAARALWEVDRGPWDRQRYLPKVHVTPFQILLAGVLAVIYALSIFFLLASFLILPSWWVFLTISPFILVVAVLVAWHNARLWSFQAVEYEEMLKDEQSVLAESERLKQMRRPSSSWEAPPK